MRITISTPYKIWGFDLHNLDDSHHRNQFLKQTTFTNHLLYLTYEDKGNLLDPPTFLSGFKCRLISFGSQRCVIHDMTNSKYTINLFQTINKYLETCVRAWEKWEFSSLLYLKVIIYSSNVPFYAAPMRYNTLMSTKHLWNVRFAIHVCSLGNVMNVPSSPLWSQNIILSLLSSFMGARKSCMGHIWWKGWLQHGSSVTFD